MPRLRIKIQNKVKTICARGEFVQCRVGELIWRIHILVKWFSLWVTNKGCFLQSLTDTEERKLLIMRKNNLFVFLKKRDHIKLKNMIKP